MKTRQQAFDQIKEGTFDVFVIGGGAYAINPARDLGPRIVHPLLPLGKKIGSGWSYAAVPVIGPLIGAGLAHL